MTRSLRSLALVALAPMLVLGCQKKDTPAEEIAQEAESKLPDEDKAPAPVAPPAVNAGAPAADATIASATTAPSEQADYEAWFKKYSLDLNDPKMLEADPDGDGFSNRDEFLADTDPHDKNSRPGLHKLIRLKEYTEVRLPIELESIEGDKARIKRTDQPDAKAITVKVGDTIQGLPLKVQHIEVKEDIDKGGEKIDLSQVAFEDPMTHEKVVLMKDLPARTAATYAVLTSPDGKATLKVRKGDVFSWPGEDGTHYKVMDLSQDQAVLFEVENKKTWTIPRM